MRRPRAAFVLLACSLAACAPALAWGALGHRLVAALAQDELGAQAQREVALLLEGEAEPTLPGVATWADELRANDPDLGKRSAPWHYVNLGEHGCTYEVARDCAAGDCVVGAIRAQAAILADRTRPLAERRQALKFVVHFVGDVHQPLHAGFAHDKGGNTFQLHVHGDDGKERGTNLHSYWDSGMLREAALDESAWLQRLRAMPLAVEIERRPLPPDATAWARNACTIATSAGFYPPRATLGPDYATTWRPTAEAQLRRAGTHLAVLLNAALDRQGVSR
jgi:hypothetical protein